jgi:hypothetical protein
MSPADDHDDVIWVQVDGSRCIAVSRRVPPEEQARAVDRVAYALEALHQHGSTSAEEALVGVPLADISTLRSSGFEVVPIDVFRAGLEAG